MSDHKFQTLFKVNDFYKEDSTNNYPPQNAIKPQYIILDMTEIFTSEKYCERTNYIN